MRATRLSSVSLVPIHLPSRIGRLSDRMLWLSFFLSVSVHAVGLGLAARYFTMPSFDTFVLVDVGQEALEMEIGAAYSAADLRVKPPPDAPESRFIAHRPDAERESELAKAPVPGNPIAGELLPDLVDPEVYDFFPSESRLGEKAAPDRIQETPLPETPDLTVEPLSDNIQPIPVPDPPEARFEETDPAAPADPEARPLVEDALLAAAVLPDPGHWLEVSQLPVASARPVVSSAPRRPSQPASPPSSAPLYAATPLPLPERGAPPPVDPAKAEIRFTALQPPTRSRAPLVRPEVSAADIAAVLADSLPLLGLTLEELGLEAAPVKSRRFPGGHDAQPAVQRPAATVLSRLARSGPPVSRWSGGAVLGLRAPATVIGYFHPVYPVSSMRRGEQGTALVAVKINIQGKADEVRLVRSTGFQALDQAAIQAAWRASYQPEIIGGLPVTAVQRFDIHFHMR